MKIIYLAGGNRLSTELKEEQVEFVELLGPKVSYHPQKEKDTETKQIDGALMLANQVKQALYIPGCVSKVKLVQLNRNLLDARKSKYSDQLGLS